MSRHHGPASRGRMRDLRADKRREAEERDARLGEHDPRRRQVRLAAERLTGLAS